MSVVVARSTAAEDMQWLSHIAVALADIAVAGKIADTVVGTAIAAAVADRWNNPLLVERLVSRPALLASCDACDR